MLVTADVDGHGLDEIDFNLFFLLLVDAGGDTTRNLVAGGMARLPDLQKIGETEWQPSTFISGPRHIRVGCRI